MKTSKLNLEIIKTIEELELNSHGQMSANIGAANFIYLLSNLERDFKKNNENEPK